jgi:hypothetical protein
MRRVRVGSRYTFQPVVLDQLMARPWFPTPGTRVVVIEMPGAPRANTMGHAYIATESGAFAGLVCTNSLVPLRGAR